MINNIFLNHYLKFSFKYIQINKRNQNIILKFSIGDKIKIRYKSSSNINDFIY